MDNDDDYLPANRITKAVDLPSWFDTKKYESVVHLDARGWEEQLVVRQICYEELWQADPGADLSAIDHLGFRLDELLAAIREKPIYPFYSSTFHDSYSYKDFTQYRPKNSIAPGLSTLTPNKIISLVRGLPVKRQRKLIKLLSSKKERFSIHSRPESHWLSEPIERRLSNLIEVDRYLPNKLLLQSFEHYLMNSEGWEGDFKGRPHRSNLFLEWCNCGLLQYIDLEMWSLETNSTITKKALARGIFPNNWEKGEDNIRTTTDKHATSILHDRVVMHTLRAYAQQEEDSASD